MEDNTEDMQNTSEKNLIDFVKLVFTLWKFIDTSTSWEAKCYLFGILKDLF